MAESAGMGATVRDIVDAAAAGSAAALHGSAAGRILQPERYGGLALPADEFVAVVGELAVVDGSLGWCVAMVNAASREVGYLHRAAADEVWKADPHALIATSYQSDGGSIRSGVLTGHWEAVVGAEFADWMLLSARDGVSRRVLVPRGTARLEPVDSRAGLQLAGLCDVSVEEAPIDPGWILPTCHDDVAVVAGAGMAAAVVGTADGVWRKHVEQLRERLATSHGGQEVTDESSAQLARAASDIDAAKLQVVTALARPAGLAAATWAYGQAVERGRDAVDRILGSSRHALDASSPVTRMWRDVHAGCRLADQLLDGLAGTEKPC